MGRGHYPALPIPFSTAAASAGSRIRIYWQNFYDDCEYLEGASETGVELESKSRTHLL